ncbi:MAG: hypothetical protein AAGI10_00955 [Pseudomonadota bacterium]
MSDKIEVQNINAPNYVTDVDRAKYQAMRDALLGALATDAPGKTAAEMKSELLKTLDQEVFPGGEKAGWWMKCVQLDLEAKGLVLRANTKPLRFRKVT